jgi:predicted ATPase/DNA-binding winged helix-turn-helix (wHTH) protein
MAIDESAAEAPANLAFGRFQVLPHRRELLADGRPIKLGGRAYDVLMALIEARGAVIGKDTLMARVWPDRVVEENNLQAHISSLRAVFGAERDLIRTVSGRGYQFTGEIRILSASLDEAGSAAAEPGALLPPTNLPEPISELIGRDNELSEILSLAGAYRLVTLTGAGGIGKTRLVLAAGRRLLSEFADGVWLVELASLSDANLVPSRVAGVLRLGLGSNNIVPEFVARVIRDRKLLLVLDNCEHLIGAAANLAETLLALCPNITILVTSREILRIQGECVYRVSPLDVPSVEHIGSTAILGHSAARLFIARAAEAGADLSSNSQHSSTIAAICRHLDGIPLAIEFAAARAATLGIEQVAVGLRDRFELLTSGRRTALPRHRTLRATLDWSFELLTEAERELLRRLAIFAGPFSLAAACAVTGETMTAGAVAVGIADLVGKSLVIRTADPATTQFRLLETTRAYALDRLNASGALAEVAHRHASYFLGILATVDELRQSQPADEHLATIRDYADEIHAALEWAFSPAGDPAIGMALTIAAIPLWFELFQIVVAHTRLRQALSYAEPGSDQEMRLRIAMGHALWYGSPESVAIEPIFARALEIAERIGATAVRTQALWGLWASCRCRAEYPAALEMACRFADVAQSTGDVGAMHLADRILGLTHHFLGHQPTAREFTERALRHAHHLDSSLGLGYQVETPVAMAAQLARILWLQGFPDQAMVAAIDAVTAARDSGHSYAMVYALAFGSVSIALWTGDIADAGRLIELLIAHSAGNQRTEQWVRCFAGVLRLRNGNESEALVASFIEPRVDLFPLHRIADLLSQETLPVPLPGPEPADVLWNTPELLRVDAELLLWHNAPGAGTAAEAKLLRALEIAREQTALSWELRIAMSLASLWQRHGCTTATHDLLSATYAKFTEGFETADLRAARALLDQLSDQPSLR